MAVVGLSLLQGSHDSSSGGSSHRGRHRGRRNRGAKRSKVEYITTFGNDDDEEDYEGDKDFFLSHLPGMSAGRPSDAASKVAASVVSSLFKNSTSREGKSQDSSRTKSSANASAASAAGLASFFISLFYFCVNRFLINAGESQVCLIPIGVMFVQS